MTDEEPGFEDKIYDQFPAGADEEFGPPQGFNEWVQINDPSLFKPEALENPVVAAFVNAPIAVTFAQFKSSHRESEYFIHKPVRAMTGGVDGIVGSVPGIGGGAGDPGIATLVINHERTLARHITRALVITDQGGTAGQILHKEEEP